MLPIRDWIDVDISGAIFVLIYICGLWNTLVYGGTLSVSHAFPPIIL